MKKTTTLPTRRLNGERGNTILLVVASVALLSIFGFLQWRAVQETDEARKNEQNARAVAEEVLDYLVFDLQNKLAASKRTELADDIRQRVDQFEALLGNDQQTARALNRRTATLLNEGNRLLAKGDSAEALTAYQQTLDSARQASEIDPEETVYQRNVLSAKLKLGDTLFEQGRLDEAKQAYQDGLDNARKLIESGLDKDGRQRDASIALEKLGTVLKAQGQLAEAGHAFRECLSIRKKLSEQNPDNIELQRDVSVALNKLGDVLFAQDQFNEALAVYQDDLKIAESLAARSPDNAGRQRDLSITWENMANVMLAHGKNEEAVDLYKKSLTIREKLAAKNPSKTLWQRDLTSLYAEISAAMLGLDRFKEAAEYAERRVAHAGKAGDKVSTADAYLSLAWCELFNGNPEKAIQASQEGLKTNNDASVKNLLNTNLAHGYLFSGQFDKAKDVYLAFKDNTLSDGRSFKQTVLDDFADFRKHGIGNDDMKRIEQLL